MRHAEQKAKSAAKSKVGIFAVPSRFFDGKGSGAPYSRRRRIALAVLALLAVAALGAGTAAGADPTVSVDPVATHGITTAHATGTITTDSEANGGAETFYFFEFRQVKPVGEEEEWSFGPQAFTRTVPAETTALAVEEDLNGLKANTAYEVRLAAFPVIGGESYSAPSAPFTTDPAPNAPVLALDPVVPFYTSAQISGTVDPEGGNLNSPGNPVPIHWTIEISESGDPGTWAPVGEGDITGAEAEGTAPIAVPASAAEPTGLAPNATYHYRLRAAYAGLEVETDPAATFTTEAVAKPTVTLDPITTHSDTTATFTGEVDTNAPAVLNPQAEAAFKADWHISCTPACPNLAPAGGAGSVEAAEGSKAISVDATGLEPNTSYEVTLEASNAGGAESDAKVFATDLVAPSVNPGPGRSDGHGGYHLEAALNPHNSAISSCVFEYGPTIAYGQSIPCDSEPGAVNKTVFVTAHVTGLTLGQPYHFRVTAANGAGPTTSADATFVPTESCPNEARREEQESTFLPECRAYEMVTSPYKQGFAVAKQTYGDDGAVSYNSLGNFAGNPYGVALFNQYVARRSETGWKTIAMNPPGEQWVFAIGEGASALSEDLQSSLWWMLPRSGPEERWTDHPERGALYVRRPDGVFSLIAPNPGTIYPRVSATTSDFSHVVVDGSLGVATPNLYEAVAGDQVLRPIGVDNTGAPLPGAGVSGASGLCSQGISADGRVILFGTGDEYSGCYKPMARVGGATTIDMPASQCTRDAGDPGGACNADAQVGIVGFARDDGSRVFMTTTQQLVNGDTDETSDVYMCEIPGGTIAPELPLNKCPDLRQLTTGAPGGAEVENVVRVSGDGSHVYFIAHAVLAANQGANDQTAEAGAHNLYVWQTDAEHPEGQTTFVARLIAPGEVGNPSTSTTQLTPDGRYLLVLTTDPLVSSGPTADTDSAADVYRYDAQTGDWLRLSTDATGSGGNAPLEAFVWFYSAMTNDGETVVFTTSEALAPSDANSLIDVYAWHQGQVSLISPEGGGSDPGISSSGTDIFFKSTSHVTAADSDTLVDVFDARVGGGFDLREPAPPCEGEACKGPLTTPPSSSGPGSAGVVDGGNVKEKPKKCPKGKRKVRNKAGKSRCVPKRSGSRHGKRHHSSGGNGGAHK